MDTYGWSDTEERNKATDELNHARIVMLGKKEIGVIKIIPGEQEFHLHQMQILPEFQKKGIGETLVRELIILSEKTFIPITLYVIKNTPAKRLYDRSGFTVTDEYKHHYKMCRFLK